MLTPAAAETTLSAPAEPTSVSTHAEPTSNTPATKPTSSAHAEPTSTIPATEPTLSSAPIPSVPQDSQSLLTTFSERGPSSDSHVSSADTGWGLFMFAFSCLTIMSGESESILGISGIYSFAFISIMYFTSLWRHAEDYIYVMFIVTTLVMIGGSMPQTISIFQSIGLYFLGFLFASAAFVLSCLKRFENGHSGVLRRFLYLPVIEVHRNTVNFDFSSNADGVHMGSGLPLYNQVQPQVDN